MKKFLPIQIRNLFVLFLVLVSFIQVEALTIVNCTPTSSEITITACNSFTYNNQTYNLSGVYSQLLTNAEGCDSTITIHLTINKILTSVIRTGFRLTAIATGVTYQWLDCNNNGMPITGKTSQTFSPTNNGNYAVLITQNSCSEVSECYDISGVGVGELGIRNYELRIYPNPASEKLTVRGYELENENAGCEIINTLGQIVIKAALIENETEINISSLQGGVYLIKVGNTLSKFVKK